MKPTVLFIDDEKDIVELFEIYPFDEISIIATSSHVEFFKILESSKIDVVVSDKCMPVMDGYEIQSVLKEKWPDIPFIMCSGNHTKEDGVVRFDKPIKLSDFEQAILDILKQK